MEYLWAAQAPRSSSIRATRFGRPDDDENNGGCDDDDSGEDGDDIDKIWAACRYGFSQLNVITIIIITIIIIMTVNSNLSAGLPERLPPTQHPVGVDPSLDRATRSASSVYLTFLHCRLKRPVDIDSWLASYF